MAKFFNYILQNHDATEENAMNVASSLYWKDIEVEEANYPHLKYVDTVNGIGIWYNYESGDYYFTDELERNPIQHISGLGDFGDFGLNENKKIIKITKDQLQELVKEGVQKLHKKTILECEKKILINELRNINIIDLLNENEVVSSEIMDILSGYLEAALWTEKEEIGEVNIDSDISDNSKIDAYVDIKKFTSQAGNLVNGIEPSQIGHDLWLTRNGHGVGFWDRGLGDVGEKLSDIARNMGDKHVFWGEDGKIEIE